MNESFPGLTLSWAAKPYPGEQRSIDFDPTLVQQYAGNGIHSPTLRKR